MLSIVYTLEVIPSKLRRYTKVGYHVPESIGSQVEVQSQVSGRYFQIAFVTSTYTIKPNLVWFTPHTDSILNFLIAIDQTTQIHINEL